MNNFINKINELINMPLKEDVEDELTDILITFLYKKQNNLDIEDCKILIKGLITINELKTLKYIKKYDKYN